MLGFNYSVARWLDIQDVIGSFTNVSLSVCEDNTGGCDPFTLFVGNDVHFPVLKDSNT